MQNRYIFSHEHAVSRDDRSQIKNQKPCILWFTGLSGSGKSTIANALEVKLNQMQKHTYLLDGDNIRMGLNQGLGFSKEDRIENIRRIGEVSKLFLDSGVIVITTFISPFESDRERIRESVEEGDFIEIFIDAPLQICEERDPKKLYERARNGEISHFTGIDSPYQKPQSPEIHLKSGNITITEAVDYILTYLTIEEYI